MRPNRRPLALHRRLPALNRHLLVLGALALLLSSFACRHGSSTEPGARTLFLVYSEPSSFPPPGDPGCTHHNAPAFLHAMTDWGGAGTLQPREGRVHSLLFDAPPPGEHWLQVFDYRFCATGCPIAVEGLSINSVQLRRVSPSGGASSCPVVWFSLGSHGSVSP
ncbi:MAG TPA: hypothetical protein VGS57_02085 [Thermoanaerobaculia bacterium]|jgi:hypothetical protein|nr:hypothetical protein [Thermoanaerobaculia bacterium]